MVERTTQRIGCAAAAGRRWRVAARVGGGGAPLALGAPRGAGRAQNTEHGGPAAPERSRFAPSLYMVSVGGALRAFPRVSAAPDTRGRGPRQFEPPSCARGAAALPP